MRFFSLFLLAVSSVASAQTTQPALMQTLTELDGKAAQVADLTADFQQEKHTPLLKKPMVSTGSVKARGQAMLWTTVKPAPTVMRVDPAGVSIYYPREKTLEIYPIAGQLGALAANPLPRLDLLKQHFTFEAQPDQPAGKLAIKLTPIDKTIREHVEAVYVQLAPESGLIDRFELIDVDGEKTTITFSNHRANTKLSDADLQLNVPGDVKTVRPLDAVQGQPGN